MSGGDRTPERAPDPGDRDTGRTAMADPATVGRDPADPAETGPDPATAGRVPATAGRARTHAGNRTVPVARRGEAADPVDAGAGRESGPVPVDREEIGATVAALSEDALEPAQRRRLLGRLLGQVRASGVRNLFRPQAAVRWMADTVADIAPHVPIRELDTLQRHFPGLAADDLAARLVRNAARATAGVGAAGGGIAAMEWAATPTLLSAPVLLAAETVAVVAIEIKLIGELHQVYGVPVPGGGGAAGAVALVQAWAGQRGVNPLVPGVGVGAVLGTAARKELRETLLRRFGRNLTTLGPFLTGAAVAGYLNSRATRGLGDKVRADLRGRRKELGD